jgi:hypothetical protein
MTTPTFFKSSSHKFQLVSIFQEIQSPVLISRLYNANLGLDCSPACCNKDPLAPGRRMLMHMLALQLVRFSSVVN